jgi:hypothetical protein
MRPLGIRPRPRNRSADARWRQLRSNVRVLSLDHDRHVRRDDIVQVSGGATRESHRDELRVTRGTRLLVPVARSTQQPQFLANSVNINQCPSVTPTRHHHLDVIARRSSRSGVAHSEVVVALMSQTGMSRGDPCPVDLVHTTHVAVSAA